MAKDEQLLNSKSQDNFTTEKINVISNCLFGNYVGDEYVIADEIKEELLKDKKVKKSVYKNSVFCSAYIVGYGDVVFEAVFQKNTVKNVAMAELFVLENEYKVNGYIQNTIRTKIGEFVAGLDNFIEKAYEYFNIVITDDDNKGKKYNLHEDISLNAYINAKKNFNLSMAKLTNKEYNKLYKKYVTARLEKLKKINNNFSNDVLNKFNGEFAKIEKYFLRDNNYKAVSELLDKCIEDCSGINPKFKQDEQEVMRDLTPLIEEFSKEADSVYDKAHPKALDHLNKPDKVRMEDIERELHEQEEKTRKLEDKIRENKQSSENATVSTSSSGASSSTSTTSSSITTPQKPQTPPRATQQPTYESPTYQATETAVTSGGTDRITASFNTSDVKKAPGKSEVATSETVLSPTGKGQSASQSEVKLKEVVETTVSLGKNGPENQYSEHLAGTKLDMDAYNADVSSMNMGR